MPRHIVAVYQRTKTKGSDNFDDGLFPDQKLKSFPLDTTHQMMLDFARELSNADVERDWRLWDFDEESIADWPNPDNPDIFDIDGVDPFKPKEGDEGKDIVVTYISTLGKGNHKYNIDDCETEKRRFPVGTSRDVMLRYEVELSNDDTDFDWIWYEVEFVEPDQT